MNETLKEFSLAGDKLMPEMHLRPDLHQKFKETGDSRYFYQSKLDETCFSMTRVMDVLKI